MSKRPSIGPSLLLLVAGGLIIGLTAPDARAAANPNPGVAPPQSRSHGNSYGEWGVLWSKWLFSFPLAAFPPAQSGAVDASAGQSGSVWFLAGTGGGGHVERTC